MPPVRNDTSAAEGGGATIVTPPLAAAGTAGAPDMPVPKQQDTHATHDDACRAWSP
ncbi:hypothetical protein [Burkholderia cenocepacia]|jgi:hypothetical protein|uniref:hypothetical protein n=1 Tax=Burkholderia cenocepacia TaxID=95486 RepID=UPI000D87901C|nr:hypothetical protein [Burkholderia cenocepacia]SPV03679.1 Uncharacterised protein [Burkholderia cenocepacia]